MENGKNNASRSGEPDGRGSEDVQKVGWGLMIIDISGARSGQPDCKGLLDCVHIVRMF